MGKPAWLKQAEDELGFVEGPDNETKYGRFYGLNHQPWCAMFVSWCCLKSGNPLPSMQPGLPNGFASVWYGMQFARANDLWRHSWNAEPGDAIVYGWDGPGSSPENMHVGFVVESGPRGSLGRTIEGNRDNQVKRETFTVGADIVLGTIALTKLLARESIVMTAKPDPQPRSADHPSHTGPIDLSALVQRKAENLAERLEHHDRPVAAGSDERRALVDLREAIDHALQRSH